MLKGVNLKECKRALNKLKNIVLKKSYKNELTK